MNKLALDCIRKQHKVLQVVWYEVNNTFAKKSMKLTTQSKLRAGCAHVHISGGPRIFAQSMPP